MKTVLSFALLSLALVLASTCVAGLRVSANGRFLEDESGRSFFWLADTAWELLHRLNETESRDYLRNRAEKGFTVIQTVALAEFDGLKVPNAAGDLPLINEDPTRPNLAYFDHVDKVIAAAGDLGLYVALLPTWGDKFNLRWGKGPEIFTPENARIYGTWIAQRYREAKVIWVLGGDRSPEKPEHTAIIDAMAAGIRSVVGNKQLITYHPYGGVSSSQYFHDRGWLDFNLFQSGHGKRDFLNFEMTRHDCALQPVKPVIDGEPCYEDHPVMNDGQHFPGAWFGDFEVRRAGYWSLLAGAAGHTYGNHAMWQFWQPGREVINRVRTPWREAMDYPGAFQMGIMRRLFEQYPWTQLVPRPDAVLGGSEIPAARILAVADADAQFAFAYSPYGHPFSLQSQLVKGDALRAFWMDPRTGHRIDLGAIKLEGRVFDPPGNTERGNDWVLVVDGRKLR